MKSIVFALALCFSVAACDEVTPEEFRQLCNDIYDLYPLCIDEWDYMYHMPTQCSLEAKNMNETAYYDILGYYECISDIQERTGECGYYECYY